MDNRTLKEGASYYSSGRGSVTDPVKALEIGVQWQES
jgi:hypothetical protein